MVGAVHAEDDGGHGTPEVEGEEGRPEDGIGPPACGKGRRRRGGVDGVRGRRVVWLDVRTEVLVAITSNHDISDGFEKTYSRSDADLATWHFSRDRRPDAGWQPVYDCWDYGDRLGFPPVISNEPIGPGSSVASEREPIKLLMAAAFGYVAKMPAYVFHSEAGVFGKTRFSDAVGIGFRSNFVRLSHVNQKNSPFRDPLGHVLPVAKRDSHQPEDAQDLPLVPVEQCLERADVPPARLRHQLVVGCPGTQRIDQADLGRCKAHILAPFARDGPPATALASATGQNELMLPLASTERTE